jgi:hypothetical protein
MIFNIRFVSINVSCGGSCLPSYPLSRGADAWKWGITVNVLCDEKIGEKIYHQNQTPFSNVAAYCALLCVTQAMTALPTLCGACDLGLVKIFEIVNRIDSTTFVVQQHAIFGQE